MNVNGLGFFPFLLFRWKIVEKDLQTFDDQFFIVSISLLIGVMCLFKKRGDVCVLLCCMLTVGLLYLLGHSLTKHDRKINKTI